MALALGLGGLAATLWVVGPGSRTAGPEPAVVAVTVPLPPAAPVAAPDDAAPDGAAPEVTPPDVAEPATPVAAPGQSTPAAAAAPAETAAPGDTTETAAAVPAGQAETMPAGTAPAEPLAPAAAETPAPAAPAETSAPAAPAVAGAGLPVAPDPGLVEVTAAGPLPMVGADGRQAWQVYARPFHDLTARPRIAIVVAGLGLRQSTTGLAIDSLPPAVSLAFSPYARNLDEWAARARGAGHEILLQLPMEPLDYPNSDPGPKALLTTLDPAENAARLDWTLGRAAGYVGVMTYMGSRFTGQQGVVDPVLDTLKARGLMILDSQTTARSVIPALASVKGVPAALATRAIDASPSRDAVRDRLAELERYAQVNGTAIGVAADYPGTLGELARWAAGLEQRGLVLAPLSALADTRPAAPAAPLPPSPPSVAPGKQG